MSSVSKHTTALVKHNRVMANALFEFGQAFTWLGQSEGDALGAALTQMGNTADQLSVLATENAEAESIFLDEPLEEYVRLLSSVKIAMKRRQDKKNAYVNAILDLEAKQAAYNKVLGVSGKEETVNAKLALVEKSQSLVDTTRVEYEEVSERLLEEFDRFKREKAEDMKQILLNYVNLQVPHLPLPLSPLLCLSLCLDLFPPLTLSPQPQVQFNKKTEKSWSDLLPHLKDITTETGMVFSSNFTAAGGSGFGNNPIESTVAAAAPETASFRNEQQIYSTFDAANNQTNNPASSNFREEEEEEDLVGV
jgi:hypothetical protein